MNAKVKLHGLSYGSLFENFIDAIITTLQSPYPAKPMAKTCLLCLWTILDGKLFIKL
jgi:hypothetical protein